MVVNLPQSRPAEKRQIGLLALNPVVAEAQKFWEKPPLPRQVLV